MNRLPFFLIIAMALCGVLTAEARDVHMTPGGEGRRDGGDWENALGGEAIGLVVNEQMQAGDRLLLGSGRYPKASLTVSAGGSKELPKSIVGVDRGGGLPVFAGDWSVEAPTKGMTAVALASGVSHLLVEGLRIEGYVFGVRAVAPKGEAPRTDLIFRNLEITQCRHGFYLSDCDEVVMEDCVLRRYSKHGFRFEGGCDRVTLRRCVADCSEGDAEWEKRTELFPFGFLVNNAGTPNTEFLFEDCLARNNLMPLQKGKYKNGDGFVVEGNTRDVVFKRCRAMRNQDGGFDLKVPEVRLEGCVALGNSRSFRIWETATLTNCLAGWCATGLWSNGGPVTVERCTFHEVKGAAVQTDDRAVLPVSLSGCIISACGQATRNTAKGKVTLEETVVAPSSEPGSDPRYVEPSARWDGLGEAMNSRAYPDKGYRFGVGAE